MATRRASSRAARASRSTRRRASSSAGILALPLLFATASGAEDRKPDAQKRARIEEALRAQGYVAWKEIELDDGMWEVDEARSGQDGREYDLRLDPATLQVAAREED